MKNTTIRQAKNNDIPIILGLLYGLGRPKPKQDSDIDKFRILVKKYLKDNDKGILVAVTDRDKIMGVVSYMYILRLNQTNFELYIPELIVLEKYRNKGIGRMLLDACIKNGKEKGCYRIRLESGVQRKGSHLFYKQLGFTHSSHSFSKNL